MLEGDAFPKPYWSNTSSNNIVRELVERADRSVRKEIEDLAAGGVIEKPVYEDITYEEIHSSQDNLWNVLFFTGYLKKAGERQEGRTHYLKMEIPNEEVAGLLKGIGAYEVLSNRESGTGRSDLILKEGIFRGRGIILELKVAKRITEMEEKCREALEQIEREDYEQSLREEGYLEILKYGVCFFRKGCLVRKGSSKP